MFEGRHHLEWVLTEALRGEHEDFKLVPWQFTAMTH
jgi:hypothetical protein